MDDAEIIEEALRLSPAVRYAAIGRRQQLTTRMRHGIVDASAAESDHYEELLVNPTLLMLARQRGEIDCGGVDCLVVRYGCFFQLVMPLEDGHLSVALELDEDAWRVARALEELLGSE